MNIKNLKNKFNYSNVASSVALVIAVSGVGGVAYAAGVAKNSVGSPQIKNGQVKTIDLGADSVTGPKVKSGSLSKSDLNGKAKKAFTAGPAAFHDELNFHNLTSGDPDKTIFEFTVPAGNYLVSASGTITNTGPDANDFTCEVSHPVGEFKRTIATSEVRVANGGDLGTIALDGVAFNTQEQLELTMTCEGEQAPYAGKILDPRIVAVKLGAATQK
jgi:hypothetical protein